MTDSRIDRYLSLAVGVAAIAAAVASLYQTSLAREQLRASAWPVLEQGNGGPSADRPYTRVVMNRGIGPARVRSMVVLADGKPVMSWNAAVRQLTGEGD